MDWMHGYHAHSGYSFGYLPAIMPARLRWAAMLNRHLIPASNFRYLDAGCGQGFNLVLAAALHPDSEFVGIDFMPDHIAHGRRLAERCGLDNVTFIEADFVELGNSPGSLGEFDIAICHGISTWIMPAIVSKLYELVSRLLRPGGVFYNGYNCFPGWLSLMPFQHLVLLEEDAGSADPIGAARRKLEQLGQASDALFNAYPALPSRLSGLDAFNPAYLNQEYGNRHWRPVFVSDVIDELAGVKLNFLGPATLSDTIDNVLPPAVRDLVQQQPNVRMREQMRDYATMQNFRADLYVKGRPLAWGIELTDALRAERVMANPLVARPAPGQPFKVQGSSQTLDGNHAVFTTLLDRIDNLGEDATLGRLIDEGDDRAATGAVLETLTLLMQGGWVTPRLDKPNPRRAQVTAAIAREICLGAPYQHLPASVIADAVALSPSDIILTRLVGEGIAREALGAPLLDNLDKMQRRLAKDGKPINDPAELDQALKGLIDHYFAAMLPHLQMIGVL